MKHYLFVLVLLLVSCSSGQDDPMDTTDDTDFQDLYFPPIGTSEWETLTPSDLSWNVAEIASLRTFLIETNTEAFIVLKDGRIVIEEYYNEATSDNLQPWNSAGKTLTAFTIGIAQGEGFLDIQDKTTQYLGAEWTHMSPEQEAEITLYNQLTMTSGGDYTVANTACYDPECLQYLNDPSTFWYYHNAFYTLLQPVMDEAVVDFKTYFSEKLRNRIGMNGGWITLGYNNVYFSSARSMARFGLLTLNKGIWQQDQLISTSFYQAMTNTSQDLNKSYGYLWWLNGKESYRLPQSTTEFEGMLIQNAPIDLIAGLGKDDQKLYVVPSRNLVIVRMGGNGGNELLGPSGYDTELWEKINAVLN